MVPYALFLGSSGCNQIVGSDMLNSYFNCLASIPVNDSSNSIAYYENTGGYIEISQRITELTLFLRDIHDNEVDLNERVWNIILEILV